jgi:hypothetical protein
MERDMDKKENIVPSGNSTDFGKGKYLEERSKP